MQDYIGRYRRDRLFAQIALVVLAGMLGTPFVLSLVGALPWLAAVGILAVAVVILWVNTHWGDVAPWWAYYGGTILCVRHLSSEMYEWLKDTGVLAKTYLPDDYPGVIQFRKASDATLFKLTWGGRTN